jgi:hypothetical protein
MSEPCCIANTNCTAAANFEDARARCICFACGQPVCAACSMRVNYDIYGRRRLCDRCLEEYDGTIDRVLHKELVGAGYTPGTGAYDAEFAWWKR